jgi:hypothetical protein
MDPKIIIDFLLKEKVEKSFVLSALILLLSAFVNTIKPFSFLEVPNFYRLFIGIGLIILFLLLLFVHKKGNKSQKFSLENGFSKIFTNLNVEIKVSKIEDSIIEKELKTAIVLPANTSLDEHCINDTKSALGSFVLNKLPSFKEKFIQEIKSYNSSFDVLPVGKSFILNQKFVDEHEIIITCVSEIIKKKGVVSLPENISLCIKQIFEIASENKIKHIITPIIGSGHGGINVSDALHLLVYSAVHYSKSYHHIKKLTIIIHPSNISEIKQQMCIFN